MSSKKNKKILIVEDQQSLAEALKAFLEKSGYKVVHASTGKDGFKAAISEHPDLILLDHLMPEMNGVQMLQQLGEVSEGKDIPVIMMTNLNDINTINDSLEAGAKDYIIKSDTNLEDILSVVESRVGTA